jgi:hypothetical protein
VNGSGIPWTCFDLDAHITHCFKTHHRRLEFTWVEAPDLVFQCPVCGDLFFHADNSCALGKHLDRDCSQQSRPAGPLARGTAALGYLEAVAAPLPWACS